MKREKLNNAAKQDAINTVIGDLYERGNYEMGFMSGVDWLMQQPLSERLTDEEKEKIKAFYSEASMFAKGEDVNEIEPLSHYFGRKLQLEMVFGTDLFKEK